MVATPVMALVLWLCETGSAFKAIVVGREARWVYRSWRPRWKHYSAGSVDTAAVLAFGTEKFVLG